MAKAVKEPMKRSEPNVGHHINIFSVLFRADSGFHLMRDYEALAGCLVDFL